MEFEIPSYSEKILNEFAVKQWDKTLAFLRAHYKMDDDECKDIFQDSFIILHKNMLDGKLTGISSSLSTYFIGICRNKACEYLRRKGQNIIVDSESTLDLFDSDIQQDKVSALIGMFAEESIDVIEKRESIVRQIVSELPAPCSELLWGFFRDNFTMKALAKMFGYSNENTVKVTKHRCQNKFHERFNSLKK